MSTLVGGIYAAYAAIYIWPLCIYNLQLFLSILFYVFVHLVGIEAPYRKGQWYQHLLTLFAIFDESNTKGTNFQIMCMFYVYINICNVHVLYCIVFNLCEILNL